MEKENKLKKMRKEKGFTMVQMAERLNITTAYYSHIENKKRRLFYDMAVKIADILETKPDDLFYH